MSKYEDMVEWAESEGVVFAFKGDSRLMKAIGFVLRVLRINREFLTEYTSTLGSTIYYPSREWLASKDERVLTSLIAHEVTHIIDQRELGSIRYVLMYLSPQIFGILGLLSLAGFWNPLAFYFAAFFLCLGPWKSPGRQWVEVRGYAATMAALNWEIGAVYDVPPDRIVKQFVGSQYYYINRRRHEIHWELRRMLYLIDTGEIVDEIPHLRQVKEILETR
jgi:hypothetical protein